MKQKIHYSIREVITGFLINKNGEEYHIEGKLDAMNDLKAYLEKEITHEIKELYPPLNDGTVSSTDEDFVGRIGGTD